MVMQVHPAARFLVCGRIDGHELFLAQTFLHPCGIAWFAYDFY
jgi:hypothetical protein